MVNKFIKNTDSINHTWAGMEVVAGAYYQIQESEESRWATDSVLLVDIANAIAIVSRTGDGSGHITDVNEAIDFLKGSIISIEEGSRIIPTLGKNLRYNDMNVSEGGIARGTSIVAGAGWSQVYGCTCSGLLLALMVTLEDLTGTPTNYWRVRLLVDGAEFFGTSGINMNDMASANIYNFNTGTTPSPVWAGINLMQNTFTWVSPSNLPVDFYTDIKVYVSRIGTVNKLWRAGFVSVVKEAG